MNAQAFPPKNERPSLKQPRGWFAAGDGLRQALARLSDGAFRLFVYLCLQADRRTGRFQATHKELARALGKSKRVIGSYVAELQAKAVCSVQAAKNQYARTTFEIADGYWPYHRPGGGDEPPEQNDYVQSVRQYFLAVGCGSGKFGAAEAEAARDMQRGGIPLAVIQDAMFLGACRKWTSWLNGGSPEPIRSLRYFEPIIAQIKELPLPPGYSAYLRKKNEQFAQLWHQSVQSGTKPGPRPTREDAVGGDLMEGSKSKPTDVDSLTISGHIELGWPFPQAGEC